MSKFISCAIACLALMGIIVGGTAARAAGPDAEIKTAYAGWDAAFRKADAKAIAAFYADDALFLPADHTVIRGPAGVETFFAGLLGAGITGHKLELIEARGEGNLLYGSAKWSAKNKDKEIGGVATHIFQKAPDGKLKIKLHTFN